MNITLYQKMKGDPADLTLIGEYAKLSADMATWADKADKVKLDIKNDAEMLEYTKELSRIVGKLANIGA